jgi:hypothetical protein
LVGELLGGVKLLAVVRHISKFVCGLRHSTDRRGAFIRPLSYFCGGARSGGFEAGEHQANHDPDKDAELDRNKMCKFKIHLQGPPILQMMESKELFLHSSEIFSETARYNNLKIGRAGWVNEPGNRSGCPTIIDFRRRISGRHFSAFLCSGAKGD